MQTQLECTIPNLLTQLGLEWYWYWVIGYWAKIIRRYSMV